MSNNHITYIGLLLLAAAVATNCKQSSTIDHTDQQQVTKQPYALVIHGGAGTIRRGQVSQEKEDAYTDILSSTLTKGEEILKNGGSSEEAVVAVIAMMEDSPLFNAGRGAVFTHDGYNSLDASIMNGNDLNAGSVAGVSKIKNPIRAALAVKDKSDHVLLSGAGADAFSIEHSLEVADSSYFFTQDRWDRLQFILSKEKGTGTINADHPDDKYGTVGAVALDREGNITAGTSTGGMTNKRYDRIGDSPIIGAGTYADNRTCGVSCTGHGEYFIRYHVASDVTKRMQYLGETVETAASTVIEDLAEIGGAGGLIALDHNGTVAMPFNTSGMYRGYVNADTLFIAIYGEE